MTILRTRRRNDKTACDSRVQKTGGHGQTLSSCRRPRSGGQREEAARRLRNLGGCELTTWTRETAEDRLAEIAPLVARALGEGWAREKRDNVELTHYMGLVHGDERVGLYVSYPYGRLSISGNLNHVRDSRGENPYLRGEENPKITVSLDKSPEQIARDIERRVLPGYRDVLAKALAVVQERNDLFARTAASAAAIAKVIGATDIDAKGRVSFSRSKKLPDLEGSAECSGEAVSLSFSDLTVGEVEAMLGVLMFMRKAK